MVQRFFSVRQMDLQQDHHSHPVLLLSGPPSCGKTSLLFQFAFNSAMEAAHDCKNGQVVFICNRRRLEAKPLIFPRYVDDEEGIKKYFAAFHLHDTFPVAVVIDDFGAFFDERSCQERYGNPRGRDLAMVRTLALCHNAMIHANETRPCKLVLSDTHRGDSPRLLFIYKRWVSTIFTIQGDGSGSFIVKDYSNSGGRRVTAKYSVALQNLLLEEITEASES